MNPPDDFRITFSRTGGIAGMTTSTVVDSNTADPQEAREIQQLLDSVDLDALAALDPGHPVPDGYRYDLTIERGGTSREYQFHDPGLPDQLRPLITTLTRRSLHP